MYTTAAGGATFLGSAVVSIVLGVGGSNVAVVWTFVALYAVAFVLVSFLHVPQKHRAHGRLETVS